MQSVREIAGESFEAHTSVRSRQLMKFVPIVVEVIRDRIVVC